MVLHERFNRGSDTDVKLKKALPEASDLPRAFLLIMELQKSTGCANAVVAIALQVPLSLYEGLVIKKSIVWHNLPINLTIIQIVACMYIISIVRIKYESKESSRELSDIVTQYISVFIVVTILWAMIYMFTLFN